MQPAINPRRFVDRHGIRGTLAPLAVAAVLGLSLAACGSDTATAADTSTVTTASTATTVAERSSTVTEATTGSIAEASVPVEATTACDILGQSFSVLG